MEDLDYKKCNKANVIKFGVHNSNHGIRFMQKSIKEKGFNFRNQMQEELVSKLFVWFAELWPSKIIENIEIPFCEHRKTPLEGQSTYRPRSLVRQSALIPTTNPICAKNFILLSFNYIFKCFYSACLEKRGYRHSPISP